eukprot:TRINITY_DN7688_c0_g1::TRINITY_DN7688_c0_g1_i1::g.18577::m.18577 TRINITY_DN7688_c0_g1::TRINITY_DN7688_c0_g1_i1::g.18577  ORF type:complete len:1325 (-),score=524.01,sp/Q2WEA5/TRPM1_RAT/26.08/2e-109,Ion_trans/PF00520.26/1.7e-11,Ank_2/PF12796.2/0.062,Ank_2/PF12796.2/5.8e+03,PKD_channel/PF08016.7/0.077,Ank_4/PF13637.1/0.36,Ank_4/PF13637.1/3.5e+03,Ank_4/PF13637.1/1e+04,Ank_3/PF13606.1/0.32,Ank_3/PF13606.1/1.5e+04,Ank_3/PF13606.1/1.1e+04 TRINITY_DN7688_c0_g1_i1:302-4276(-)
MKEILLKQMPKEMDDMARPLRENDTLTTEDSDRAQAIPSTDATNQAASTIQQHYRTFVKRKGTDIASITIAWLKARQQVNFLMSEKDKKAIGFIKGHVKCRACRTFVPAKDAKQTDPQKMWLPTCAGCGRYKIGHKGFVRGRGQKPEMVEAPPGTAWNSAVHTQEINTDAFGSILFQGCNTRPANFVKISDTSNPNDLKKLFEAYWEVREPKLLISVTGGAQDFSLPPALRQGFMRGLMKTATSTSAWIVTGGTDAGVMKYVGEAAALYGPDVPVIGIATWGIVSHRDTLLNVARTHTRPPKALSSPVLYVKQEPNGMAQAALDPNHTHFIMVDDGSSGQWGKEIKFRALFERAVSGRKADGSRADVFVPCVCVVVQGGPGTIETVYQAIKAGTAPVVTVKGSGKCADLIAEACEHMHGAKNTCSCAGAKDACVCDKKCPPFLCEARPVCPHILDMVNKHYGQKNEAWANKIAVSVRDQQKVVVYDINDEAADLDACILKAILKGGGYSLQQQLELAVNWNRYDIASKEILHPDNVKQHKSAPKALHTALLSAIRQDRVMFARLLLDNGADILDPNREKRKPADDSQGKPVVHIPGPNDAEDETLDYLYQTIDKKNHLYNMLKNAAEKKASAFTMQSLQRVGSQLAGMARGRDTAPAKEEDLPFWHKNVRNKVLQDLMGKDYEVGLISNEEWNSMLVSVQEELRRKLPPVTYHLMIWAGLLGRFEMAKFFWEKLSQRNPICTALAMTCLFRSLADNPHVPAEEKEDMETYAGKFEELATGVLSSCYEDDMEETLRVLEQPWEDWGDNTPIDMAIEGDNESFMDMRCCQQAMTLRWTAGLKLSQYWQDDYYFWIMIAVLCPPLIPFVIAFEEADEDDENFNALARRRETKHAEGMTAEMVHLERNAKKIYDWTFYERFYSVPATKFVWNAIMYMGFLVLYSSVVLSTFPDHFQPREALLIVWVFSMALEESFQVCENGLGDWWGSVWNKIDFAMLVLYTVAIIARFSDLTNPETFDNLRYDSSGCLSKQLMSIAVVFYFMRLLSTFSVNSRLGPLLVAVGKMMGDIGAFLFIMIVFILGFGVAQKASSDPWNWGTETTGMWIRQLFEKPYWQSYGELFLEDMEAYPLSRALLVVYMIIANILLVNLLIAMMGSTYESVGEKAKVVWLFEMFDTTDEFKEKPLMPPPFVLFIRIFQFLKYLVGLVLPERKEQKVVLTKDQEMEEAEAKEKKNRFVRRVEAFVHKNKAVFLRETEIKGRSSVEGRVTKTSDDVCLVMDKFELTEMKNEERQKKTEERLTTLTTRVKDTDAKLDKILELLGKMVPAQQ